jgi:hypothetical protein
MKKIFITSLFAILYANSFAQTGIGTTTPNASAKLDVYATNKGFLPPRVTLTSYTDISTIPNPATGLLIYNTGNNVGLAAGYYYWNGNAWATIATSGGSGSFAASFLRGSRTATQSVASGGIVSFSVVDNTSGQDISLNTINGKITLAPGNTYRLIAAVPTFTSGQRPSFMWYNETTASYIGSASSTYNTGDAASYGAFGVLSNVIITPSVTTVLSYRMLSSLSNGAVTVGGNADFSIAGSYPWFEAQVISGNAPVTGQSVDYVQASLSANQALSAVGNVIFNTFTGAGITLTGGGFELKANKTYKLEAALGGASTGYGYYAWVDNTNTVIPGGSVGVIMKAGNTYSDAPQDKAVVYYTPTTNTTVFLRVLNIAGTVTAYAPPAASNYSSTWATIQQVGSSAIVNPWTLAGNDTYNTLGKVGIGNNAPTQALDVTGNVKTSGNYMYTDGSTTAKKVSGYVNAGAFISFENIQVTVTTSGYRGLSVAAVSTPFYCNIGATFGASGGGSGSAVYNSYVTTTPSASWFGWHFINAGDFATYLVNDTTNNRVYRITMSIGASYFNNFISIERLN